MQNILTVYKKNKILYGLFFFSALLTSNSFASVTSDWMAKIADSTTINKIIMPGSHDAGMSETRNCAPPFFADSQSQTQNLNILSQAEAGSRYFDLRPDYDKSQLTTYHRKDIAGTGWGCSGQNFTSILDQSVLFLKNHPTETLFFKISHTRDTTGHDKNDIARKIIDLFKRAQYENYLYKSSTEINLTTLKMSNVRGKIVVVLAINEIIDGKKHDEYQQFLNSATGFFPYYDGTNNSAGLNVFDVYSNSDSYTMMQSDQLTKLANNGGLGKDYLFLFSWTLTPQVGASVKSVATIANNHLADELKYLQTNNYPLPNIVYLDYIDPQLTASIINLNFNSNLKL